ncbi:ArpU family phage packaging/lysis transcriptional regulator [Solibacillus sp. FSL H8-0538]|uniref:ArpU family phage packaging/lysis transcriptional regulator n=1 Tax=Solibacillus sp. FSL H8-0538 TaxID=2921400 RepID=UPI0030F966FE
MKKHIPRIDEKKTKLALEKVLDKYREYLMTLPSSEMPTITPSYSIIPPSNTNTFNSKTENVAIERAEYELARTKFMNKIIDALQTLKEEERLIIVDRFLAEDIKFDIDIWTDLAVGKNKYYKLKWQAMLRMAFALKIEVYFQDKDNRGVAV